MAVEWVPLTVLVEAGSIIPYIGRVPLREVLAQAGFSFVRVDGLRAGQQLPSGEEALEPLFSASESMRPEWFWDDLLSGATTEDFDT